MQMDLITVLVAALINLIIGYVWYSKYLFGPNWMKYYKADASDLSGHSGILVFFSYLISFVMAFVLGYFEMKLQISNVRDGIFVGVLMWLGFVATVQFSGVVWRKKPLNIFFISTFRHLLGLAVMGGILAA